MGKRTSRHQARAITIKNKRGKEIALSREVAEALAFQGTKLREGQRKAEKELEIAMKKKLMDTFESETRHVKAKLKFDKTGLIDEHLSDIRYTSTDIDQIIFEVLCCIKMATESKDRVLGNEFKETAAQKVA